MSRLNSTHAPELRSWVESANRSGHPFPIQNLPYGIFRRAGSAEPWRAGVAIGDAVLDLRAALQCGVFAHGDGLTQHALQAVTAGPDLNPLMALEAVYWSSLRLALSTVLRAGAPEQAELAACLLLQSEVEHDLPARIGDYTDFYTSIYHATAVGRLFRPDQPLLPNYQWVPIGYHGRASSIAVSGQQFHRPLGQTRAADAAVPQFGPCQRLDYEMEVGVFIGTGNRLGQPLTMAQADAHVFGLCLLNDWSARDVQAWEYQPLGPFLAKNFATTITPWIVTLEALAPYRVPWLRAPGEPPPLAYLDHPSLAVDGAFDVQLEVSLQTAAMRAQGMAAQRLSCSNFRDSYWSVAQLLAHHTSGGCNLRPGDLLGSGTQSGPQAEAAGSLLELSGGGRHAITLASGEQRRFLADGDTVIMRGRAQCDGHPGIGFGTVSGTVLPAITIPPG